MSERSSIPRFCDADLQLAMQSSGAVFHYREESGLKSDLIVRLRDGRWAAIEVKLRNKQIDEAAENFLELKARIDL
jgi:hypothetical protein